MRKIRDTQGFTLIELMIVVVIIGILAAIAIPRFNNVSRSAKQAEAAPILKQVCSLAGSDFQRNSEWPADIDAITGWDDPSATYFDFTFVQGSSTATATPTALGTTAGVVGQTMNCATGVLADPVFP